MPACPRCDGPTGEKWIDISVPLRNGMVHWPGDPRFEIHRVKDMEGGDSANLSSIAMGAHSGTHVDAPLHFIRGGASVDAMPLDVATGRARVVAILDNARITPEELRETALRREERILFKTANSGRVWKTDSFLEDFVSISTEAAEVLARSGVRLIGVDYLSVGGFGGGGSDVHRVLLEAGIWIVEGLNLRGVEPGEYELVCLPLRLEGAEGAPARAILRPV